MTQPTIQEVSLAQGWPEPTILRMMRMSMLPRVELGDGFIRTEQAAVDQLVARGQKVSGDLGDAIAYRQRPDSTGTAP